jgi:Ca2+:H+ antiporter
MMTMIKHLLHTEKFLLIAILTALVAIPLEHSILAAGQSAALIAAVAIIGVILLASQRVAHHAELLAIRFGEPYGTMLLTLSAVTVEVVLLAVIMLHTPSPTLVRDTIYSALMLDINGILGLAAIIGGLRYGEQPYNVDSGTSYIVMILTATGVSMVIPELIPMTNWHAYSIFTIIVMVLLYAMFLRLQTTRHSYFFSYAYSAPHSADEEHEREHIAVLPSVILLLTGIVLIGVLSEVMSVTLQEGLQGTGVPPIVVALVVATISASAEILTALRGALGNRMQSVVNIALGASLSTVLLTVPVMEAIALATGHPMALGLSPVQTGMVLITLLAASINLSDGETNAIEGTTHFVLFLTFLMLSALGV